MLKIYEKGEKVTIINREFSGDFIVEGQAIIVRHLYDEYYSVRFEGDKETCERFVDHAAQDDPKEFAERLTKSINNEQA